MREGHNVKIFMVLSFVFFAFALRPLRFKKYFW